MTQPSEGQSSGHHTAEACALQRSIAGQTRKERSNMAELTPWEQALLYANRANPYPFYAELRKTPVSRQEDGSYVVSTYREIVSILHDPRISSDPHNLPEDYYRRRESALGGFIALDPPNHDRTRRQAMRHFGPPHDPERIDSMRPWFVEVATSLIDNFRGGNRVDVVDDFAYPFPVTVICRIL